MRPAQNERTIDLLLVEDNPGDVRLAKEALSGIDIQHRLHVARDGIEALAFLRPKEPRAETPKPDVILLDLNLPRLGGREVLASIKGDPALRHIPVIVLTTSDASRDIFDAYDSLANAYVTKPMDLDHFIYAIQSVLTFFTRVARLPHA